MTEDALRIVITGAGLVSAAGSSMTQLVETLDRRQHCLSPISLFDATGLTATLAGEVTNFAPLADLSACRVSTLDRGTQMALAAARQALTQAALDPRVVSLAGVAVGTSGGPQYQNVRVTPDQTVPTTRLAALYAARSTPQFQADCLARTFGLGGPRFAFGSASLGGMLALAHAMDLLRLGQAPAILVGGGEILTVVNALGMDVLGLTSAGPCTPFVGQSGICFGEGAAFFVLERLIDAEARGVAVLGEVLACGVSADAYGDMAQDPTGKGLTRAVSKSLVKSGISAAAIGWIRGAGTGQRDLDMAEAIGLRTVFDDAPPPVTSTEPYFSHVNGVSPLLGLAAVLAAFATGRAPSMPDTSMVRPGLGLTLLEPGALPDGDCLLTATAFGGTNAAIVLRRAGDTASGQMVGYRPLTRTATDSNVVIAGMGAVSPLGGSVEALLGAVGGMANQHRDNAARLIDDSWLRPKLPGIQLQRRERLIRMALIAVSEALASAGVSVHGSARYGLLIGLTRGRSANYGRFFEHAMQGRFDATTGRALLRTGRFSVASEIAHAFGLLGYSGAMACGVHGGVQVLAHGAELLRASPDLDGLLVVAADEWTDLQAAFYRRLGLLGDGDPYGHQTGSGCVGGEGAAALLLCRREAGTSLDGDWASVRGAGLAGDVSAAPDPSGQAYRRAIEAAIGRSHLVPDQIDFAIGQSCGWPAHDRRESVAVSSVCPNTRLTSVVPYTGLAEGAGGLFSAIVGAGALRGGCLPAMPHHGCSPGLFRPTSGIEAALDFRHGMLLGSTERGAHAAVVLSRIVA